MVENKLFQYPDIAMSGLENYVYVYIDSIETLQRIIDQIADMVNER